MSLHLSQKTPPGGPLGQKAARLNNRFAHHSATSVMAYALANRSALVSSFGAQSVVLLHMLSIIDRAAPVLFIDTEMLFAQTLVYQHELAERLHLQNITILRSPDIAVQDPKGSLHKINPDACCTLRKTRPLNTALKGYPAWITGRKRFQSSTRAALAFFEPDPTGHRLKINPLAHWSTTDVQTYMEENRLPRHPLVAKGYPSIGCQPCTTPVATGEDPRAGRWRNTDKDECGLHFVNGKLIRQGDYT
ncbi:MAG: phosphoadenylyl-sulfate reductase [Sedimentitalea sp.]